MRAGVDPAPLAKLAGSIDARDDDRDERRGRARRPQLRRDGAQVPRRRLRRAAAAQRRRRAERRRQRRAAAQATLVERIFAPDFARLAGQHLLLVFGSLVLAIAVGVPLGVAAWRWPRCEPCLLGAVALLQTIPSLALLAFLIALVGSIGVVPARARALSLRVAADRAQHARRPAERLGRHGAGRAVARHDGAPGAAPRAAAARRADAARRHQDGGGDQRRHRDDGRVHRRRRLRRAHRRRPGRQRQPRHAGRCVAGGGAGADRAGRIRLVERWSRRGRPA